MANSNNMLGSIDWGKLLNSEDLRNAAIGAGLGGLLVGGTSLFSERDPEESKLTPVGDALLGALLGGVAGYGIPKAMSLFRDSGSLAPTGDTLKTTNLMTGVPTAALLGGGAIASTIPVTLWRNVRKANVKAIADNALNVAVGEKALDNARKDLQYAQRKLQDAIKNKAVPEELAKLREGVTKAKQAFRNARIVDVARIPLEAGPGRDVRIGNFNRMKNAILTGLKSNNPETVKQSREMLKLLQQSINKHKYGVGGLSDLFNMVGDEKAIEAVKRTVNGGKVVELSAGKFKTWFKNLTNGSHYKPVKFINPFARMAKGSNGVLVAGPKLRMAGRVGKYGLAAGGIALLINALRGKRPVDNFNN